MHVRQDGRVTKEGNCGPVHSPMSIPTPHEQNKKPTSGKQKQKSNTQKQKPNTKPNKQQPKKMCRLFYAEEYAKLTDRQPASQAKESALQTIKTILPKLENTLIKFLRNGWSPFWCQQRMHCKADAPLLHAAQGLLVPFFFLWAGRCRSRLGPDRSRSVIRAKYST